LLFHETFVSKLNVLLLLVLPPILSELLTLQIAILLSLANLHELAAGALKAFLGSGRCLLTLVENCLLATSRKLPTFGSSPNHQLRVWTLALWH